MLGIKVTTTSPSTVHAPKPTYSHIARATLPADATLVTIAGQVGTRPDGTTPPDFASQVGVALDNLGACLTELGLGPQNVLKVTHYVVGPNNAADPQRAGLYVKFMGEHRPPSTLVGVPFLADPELLYEIEALACY